MLSERLQQLPPPLAQEGASPMGQGGSTGLWARQSSSNADPEEVCLGPCLCYPVCSLHLLSCPVVWTYQPQSDFMYLQENHEAFACWQCQCSED